MDTYVGIFFILFSLLLFSQVSAMSANAIKGGAGDFPKMIAWMMMFLAVTLTIRSLFDKNALQMTFKKAGTLRVISLIVASIVYIALMDVVGFLISSLLFFPTLLFIFKHKRNWLFVVLSISVPCIIFYLFKYILLVPLP